jgi:Flp pilus assembly protein protease CpaA
LIELLIWCLLLLILIIATSYDIKYMIIPNWLTIFSMFLFLIVRLFYHPLGISYYLSGLLTALALLIFSMLLPNALGGGDIKLFGVIGLALGGLLPFLIFLVAYILIAVFYVFIYIVNVIKKREQLKYIPFGPYILFAFLIYSVIAFIS